MADASPPPTPPPAPPTLFDCVIRDDFDGMVRLYAMAARDSAVSYAAFRRWNRHHPHDASSEAEEKIDESEQQQQQQEAGSAWAASASAASFPSQRVDVSGEASVRLGLLLQDLNDIISPSESDDEDEADANGTSGLDHDVHDDDIANSNSHQLPARKKKRQSTSPRSELLTKQFGDEGPYGFVEDNTEVEDFIQGMCHADQGKSYLEEEEEQAQAQAQPPPPPAFLSEHPFARVLSEAAAMVTNARPPPSFTVSRRDNEIRLDNRERERIRRLRLREAKQEQRRRQMQCAASAASSSYSTDDYEDANDGTAKISGDDRSDHSASGSFASCCSEEYLSEDDEDDLTDDDSEEEEEEEEEQPAPVIRIVRRGPPLFDGSVANATPGNGGDGGAAQQQQQQQVQADAQGLQQAQQEGQQPQPQPQMGGGDQGGGAGTILHLACAIDSPFALAILLALGGDVLTRHTAFRRLVVHEAASAGSPECLRLMLEFADLYRAMSDARMKARICRSRVGANGMPGPTSNPGTSTGMPTGSVGGSLLQHLHQRQQQRREQQERLSGGHRSMFLPPRPDHAMPSLELGGFPSWNGQDSTSLPSVHSLSPPLTKASPTRSSRMPRKTQRRMSFVDTLRLISDLAEQIKNGLITDLAAGRLLMSRAGVPTITKSGLISFSPLLGHAPSFNGIRSSMDVLAFPHPSFATWHHPRRDADGHGNGPLHWASFKNNANCVSVLLEHNANPNARAEPSGWTPLHDAAYSDAADCVDLLVKAGADVDARANSGATPLCFAAQEDAPGAAKLLLEAGADPGVRCAHGNTAAASNNTQQQQPQPSRFSGYTPLHYCSHYNAHRAARILLEHEQRVSDGIPSVLLRMPDFNEKLPIHVAVQRSSSDVLKELLHAGAVIDTRGEESNVAVAPPQRILAAGPPSSPSSPPRLPGAWSGSPSTPATSPSPSQVAVVTPVSSPVLRSMLPARPVQSSKPWNCVTQESINQCRALIREAEGNWCPERHALFHPNDRKAIVEVLRVGRRLEQMGEGIYVYDIFRSILHYVGRGWFEQNANKCLGNCCDDDDSRCETEDRMEECDSEADDGDLKPAARLEGDAEGASFARSIRARPQSSSADVDFTQFHLE